LAAGLAGLEQIVSNEGLHCRQETLHKVLAWAEQAPPGHPHSLVLRRVLCALDDDHLCKCKEINDLERSLAGLVATTPYALLLAIPGINVVTVADLAGEMGPIELYANANAITGRAALMPSRYQSASIDCANGPLRRRGNRRLRAVLMQTADNLVQCNHYFRAQSHLWLEQGKDPRWIRVKVAKRFSRLLYGVVAGKEPISHPCCRERHYVLQKLLAFHGEHGTAPGQVCMDLQALVEQLPKARYAEEARPLQDEFEAKRKRRGARPLAEIIPIVLARLGIKLVESMREGAGPS
jgi:hypothetical protein